ILVRMQRARCAVRVCRAYLPCFPMIVAVEDVGAPATRFRMPMIGGNNKSPGMLAALKLYPMHRTGCVPRPRRVLRRGCNLAPLRPTRAVIVAIGHEYAVVVSRE